MANVPNAVETLPKISIAWVGCTNVTDRQSDRRQSTDGRTTTYSKREREFTFAKNSCDLFTSITYIKIPVAYLIITGSTVVLTCCKGDCQSQWKTPIFGPLQLGNPLTDFDKIWHRWLHRRHDPSCQIWLLYVQRGVSPYTWSCHPSGVYFLPFFYFLTFLLTCPGRIVRRRNVVNGS